MKQTLWCKNYVLLTVATVLGAMGGIAGSFALSFLVYDETGSTLAAAILIAIQVVPNFLIPLLASPLMDRLPRKPVLVAGDALNGLLYGLAGIYLLNFKFSYAGYLFFSLLLASLSAFDSLAYDSIFPKLIPAGFEEKGYTVSGMIYPVIQVVMMPVAAWLLGAIGVGWILLSQAALSLLAAAIENGIRVAEENRLRGAHFSFRVWLGDLREAAAYLKQEKGLQSIYAYMAVTNGVSGGYGPILVAFFRTAPGFTVTMYSFFSMAEFAGRSIGGLLHYHVKIPEQKRFSFAFLVYQTYELMDVILLWLPYPLMLANRAVCGFLGIQSATMRQTAVQRHLREEFRARVNAFETMVLSAGYGLLALAVGALGEVMDYRLCLTVCGLFASACCWATIWRGRSAVREVYNADS
ncbi:MAG: MFS transporter [Oscillospiraceae bacterium]|nr:MFS transporter [Oscillospiraceae bacterium]